MSKLGALRTTYTASGLARFELEVAHDELHKFQVIRGDNPQVVAARAQTKAAEWDEAWAKRSAADSRRREREDAARDVEAKRTLAAERTAEAQAALECLRTTLKRTLAVDDAIDWESLKDRSAYPVAEPAAPAPSPLPDKPAVPSEPLATDEAFKPRLGFMEFFSSARKQKRIDESQEAFGQAHVKWQEQRQAVEQSHAAALAAHAESVRKQAESHAAATEAWRSDERAYLEEQSRAHQAIDARRALYEQGDPEAVTDYCGMVLDNSVYPDYFPQDFELEFNPTNQILIVDYQLPAPSDLTTTTEVKYVAARDEFTEKALSERQLDQLYDSLLYEVALRTVHELFEADVVNALSAVAFNGWVKSVDKATGLASEACVLSLQVGRDEFMALDLANVDAKACFKKLKGVSAARLHNLTAVAPLLTMSREDKRFVGSYAVAGTLTEGDNLAAMDWEDFEHLIRELFEEEFAESGGEVKVTQASRDGGVDAVIFDPDPLRGGKTVVQAKRYTNTVGVSAVRDLYGTMMNEGANRGILVTTSDYGPDAYEFAKGKPLVLLNGGNLLHLLATHGHKARIDLQEAKLLATEST